MRASNSARHCLSPRACTAEETTTLPPLLLPMVLAPLPVPYAPRGPMLSRAAGPAPHCEGPLATCIVPAWAGSGVGAAASAGAVAAGAVAGGLVGGIKRPPAVRLGNAPPKRVGKVPPKRGAGAGGGDGSGAGTVEEPASVCAAAAACAGDGHVAVRCTRSGGGRVADRADDPCACGGLASGGCGGEDVLISSRCALIALPSPEVRLVAIGPLSTTTTSCATASCLTTACSPTSSSPTSFFTTVSSASFPSDERRAPTCAVPDR